jgi:hypothetical protein
VVLLYRFLLVPSLQMSLNSWNSVKLIGKFILINDGILTGVCKIDRYVVIYIF